MFSPESVACFIRCQQITVIVPICHSHVIVGEIPIQNICFAWLQVRNFTQMSSPLYTPKKKSNGLKVRWSGLYFAPCPLHVMLAYQLSNFGRSLSLADVMMKRPKIIKSIRQTYPSIFAWHYTESYGG